MTKKFGSLTLSALGKNPKLTPKWLGPYKIVDVNENNAKLEIKNNKFKIVNVSRLKTFCEPSHKNVCLEDPCLSQAILVFFKTQTLTAHKSIEKINGLQKCCHNGYFNAE